MEVDRSSKFVDQATMIASADRRLVVRPPANAAILTVETDETTEFAQKAIPAGKPPSCGE